MKGPISRMRSNSCVSIVSTWPGYQCMARRPLQSLLFLTHRDSIIDLLILVKFSELMNHTFEMKNVKGPLRKSPKGKERSRGS